VPIRLFRIHIIKDIASKMDEVSADELKNAVQHQLLCKAWLAQTVPVHEKHNGETVWQGIVHVFDLDYHGSVTRAYAWSYELPDGKRRFFVVEHKGVVDSPEKAVRAAIVAEHKSGK
jgi:hypothetical protein